MRTLLLMFFAFPFSKYGQTQPSQQQVKYLYDAGRLWGNVKYFHPYLQYKAINWDSSFMSAVPKILACTLAKQYAAVLNDMLSVLQDDATTASFKKDTGTANHFINTERGKTYLQDSILIVRLNDKVIADDWNETVKVTSKASLLLDSAKAVLFDFRNTSPDNRLAQPDEMNYEFITSNGWSYYSLNQMLCTAEQLLPSERFVVHEGFKPEGPRGYTYQPYFRLNHSNAVESRRQKPIRIVFLLNKNVAVPQIAVALQKKGLATILSEDKNIEGRTITTINYVIDSVDISLRKAELVDENGLLPVKEDSLLTPNTDYNINLQVALAVARKPIRKQSSPSFAQSSYTGLWNPDTYDISRYPDLGYRVLAAAKMYSVIRFFNPDKDLFDNNWDSVFLKYLPQYVTAKDSVEYMKAVAGMYSNMQDSHGFAMSAVRYAWDTLFGTGSPTCIRVARVENKSVVSLIVNDSTAKKEGFELGDVIESINGRSPDDIINEAARYFPTSNSETKYRDISNMLLRGNDSTTADVLIQKPGGKRKHITALRSTKFYGQYGYAPFFRNEMPVCKILDDKIGYIDLLQLSVDNVDSVMNVLRNTKAIIFDDRSYPPAAASQLVNYLPLPAPGSKRGLSGPVADADLVANEYRDYTTEVAWFYRDKYKVKDHKWTYAGKTVVLINEWTQSYAEGIAGSLRECGAVCIGSHTAGANGDVTNFNLPGEINLTFSGHKPFNAKGVTEQRIGLQPDIKAEPTIRGVREGKDEVLERAIRYAKTGK